MRPQVLPVGRDTTPVGLAAEPGSDFITTAGPDASSRPGARRMTFSTPAPVASRVRLSAIADSPSPAMNWPRDPHDHDGDRVVEGQGM